jgi:hypothetical protein
MNGLETECKHTQFIDTQKTDMQTTDIPERPKSQKTCQQDRYTDIQTCPKDRHTQNTETQKTDNGNAFELQKVRSTKSRGKEEELSVVMR